MFYDIVILKVATRVGGRCEGGQAERVTLPKYSQPCN